MLNEEIGRPLEPGEHLPMTRVDKLLSFFYKIRFVFLPCRIGQEVYFKNWQGNIESGFVDEIRLLHPYGMSIEVRIEQPYFHHWSFDWSTFRRSCFKVKNPKEYENE